ncbi:MAG: hypothetical protein HYX44_01830 [Aquabacterium sp.]|nr:hypothetical protein [Aquabacterium sp.]
MNPNRRLIVAWSLLQVTLAGTGCSSTPKLTRQTYTEKVSTVMITQDKKQFVILGERYHYIFAAPEDLVALLGSPLKAKAAARFQPFLVTVDGVTTGDFHLTLPVMVYFAVLVPILIPLIFLTREKKPADKATAAAVAPTPASAP